MSFTVFYSWQSDLPAKRTRNLIHAAAKGAIDKLGSSFDLDEPPRLEQGVEGVSGNPPIGDTIRRRIDRCSMFLADLSLVATTAGLDGKKVKHSPNPNVLFELGYAFARIGWERTILVMNAEYGLPQELPFDLRHHRFPLIFNTARGDSDLEAITCELSGDIESSLRSMVSAQHQLVTDVVRRLSASCLHIVKEFGNQTQIYQENIGKNSMVGEFSLAMNRLLDLGLIQCKQWLNEQGHIYEWTYLGRLAIEQLGFSASVTETVRKVAYLNGERTENVIVNTDFYDQLKSLQTEKSDHDLP